MRLRPVHLLVLLIVFILIKHRFVLAGRKYFLKKLLKGAVLASLIRPNYVPIPVPVPMSHHPPLTGHLNTPHFSMPPLPHHHHQAWPTYRHNVHHLPELPLNSLSHSPIWSGWNDLQASMRSPVIAQPHSTQLSSPISGSLPFGMPLSSESAGAFLSGKSLAGSDYQQSSALPNLSSMDNLIYSPAVDPLELSASTPNYSFRKWFKKDLKKSLI